MKRSLILLTILLSTLCWAQETVPPERVIVIEPPAVDTKPAALFFTAETHSTTAFSRDEITGNIQATFTILQGKPEVLTLALNGEGEITDVTGEQVQFWAVRQGTGEQSGQRFLEIRPHLPKQGEEAFTTFTAAITTRNAVESLPIETTLLTLAPGDAIGYNGRLDLHPSEAIGIEVLESAGWTVLETPEGTLQQRYQTSQSNQMHVRLDPRGAGALPVQLSRVRLTGEVNADETSARFTLTGQATVREVNGARLRVLAGRAALHTLPQDDSYTVRLITRGEEAPYYEVAFNEVGEFPIELGFDALISTADEWRSFQFRVPSTTIVPLTLSGLPDDVLFDGRCPVFPTKAENGWLGFLPPNGLAHAAWRPGRDEADGKLFFATSELTEISVSAGLLRQDIVLHLNVLQGKLDQLAITLQGSGEILSVEGPHVLGWTENDNGDGTRRLEIPVSRPFEGQSQLTIRSQTAVGDFPVTVKPIRLTPIDTVRHSGNLRVGNQGAVRVEVNGVQGMTQLSSNQFPAEPSLTKSATQVFVYRIPTATYDYEILADQIMPEVALSQIALYEMGELDRRINVSLELDIREAPLREWSLRIPEDYNIVSVTGADVADHVVGTQPANGTKLLNVLFSKMISGRHVVNLQLEKNEAPAAGDWNLPPFEYPNAKTVRGHIGVLTAPGYRATTGTIDKLSELPLSQFPVQKAGLQQAYRLREADWTASINVEALGQNIQADVFHLYSLKQGMVYGSVIVNYFVVGAPVSEWRLQVPAEVGNVGIDGEDVQSWRQEANELIVTLHQPALGPSTLLLTFEEPMPAEGGAIQPGQVTPVGVQGERGYIQLVSPYQVQHEIAQSTGLLALEATELPTEFRLLTSAPSLVVFQYGARPIDLQMSIQWYEPGETADQIIDHGRLTSQVARDGQVATEARFLVKTRGHQALRLRLPPNTSLWDVQVDGRSVTARADGEVTMIPLTASVDPNAHAEVVIRLGQTAQSTSRLTIAAPVVDAPMLISEWTVRSDRGRLLLPSGAAKHQLTVPQLTETGFQWLEKRGWQGGLGVAALALLGGLIIRGAQSRLRPLLGIFFTAAAIVLAGILAHEAYENRLANQQTLKLTASVVTPEHPLSLDLKQVPVWRAMISIWGVIAIALGIALCFPNRFSQSLQGHATSLAAVLIGIGLLAQHFGAVLFFLASAVWLLLTLLRTGAKTYQANAQARRVEEPKEEESASDEDEETGQSTVAATTSLWIAVGVSAAAFFGAGSEMHAADATLPADRLIQSWRIEGNRLYGMMEVSVNGEAGDLFQLLKAPAVLTEFDCANPAVRVTKRSNGDAVDYWLTLDEKAAATVTASFEMALGDAVQMVAIPTSPAAVDQLTVTFNQAGWRLSSPAAMRTTSLETAASQSSVEFLLGLEGKRQVVLEPRSRDLSTEEAQYYVEVSNLYVPKPGVVDGRHVVAIRPSQGRVRNVTLTVPLGFTVSDVLSETVNTWRFDPESRQLRVELQSALGEPFQLTVLSQQGTDSLPVDVSLEPIRVTGAAGEVGMLALAFGPDAQPESAAAQGLSPVNLEDFNNGLLEEGQVLHRVYRYGADPGNVAVRVAPVSPEVRVVTQQTLSLGEERLVHAVDLTVNVARAGVFQLRFPIPDGLDVEAISGDALDHWSELTENDQRVIVLHLRSRSLGQLRFAVSLAGTAPDPQDNWTVPRFTLTGAARATGQLVISPQSGLRVQAITRRNVSQLDTRQIARKRPGTLAYRLLQDDWELQLRIEKLDAWITARALQEIILREGQTRTRLAIDYQIQNAATKAVQLVIPGLSSEEESTVRVSGKAVNDIVRMPGQEDLWEVRFHRGVLGKALVTIDFQQTADRANGTETLQPVRFSNVQQVTHWLGARASGRLDIQLVDQAQHWQAVDWSALPQELMSNRDRSIPALCVRAITGGDQPLQVAVVRQEVAEALKLRVAGGALRSILSAEGEVVTTANLTIDVAEKSPLRVTLPNQAVLYNAFVNGQSVALVRDEAAYLFHVFPQGDTARAQVTFSYGAYGRQALSSTTLAGPRLNIPLQNITWRVYLPNGYRLADASGDFEISEDRDSVTFDFESYLTQHQQRRSRLAESANVLMSRANSFLREGRQDKAAEALQSAANASVLDAALNEDARVQLRQLQTEQAVLGLNTRRQFMVTDNKVEVPQFARNEQLEEAARVNPVLQGHMNYKPDKVSDYLLGNTADENTALKRMAGRLVSQQSATEPALRGLDVTLPLRGEILTFQRSVQVDGDEALAIKLRVAPVRQTRWWFAGLAILVLGLVALAGTFAPRASV